MRASACAVLASACSLVFTSAFASATYDCAVTPLSRSSWMPQNYKIEFDRGFVQAKVVDTVMDRIETAIVRHRSPRSLVLTWDAAMHNPVDDDINGDAVGSRRFRVVLNVDNLKMSVVVAPSHSVNKLVRGAGRCYRVQSRRYSPYPLYIQGQI